MFGLFNKKSEKEKLQDLYAKLMKESYELSHTDRKASDLKIAEAEVIARRISEL